MKEHFDIARFALLLKLELHRSRKGILMTFVISFGLLLFLGLLMTPVFEPTLTVYRHEEAYAVHLLIGGFILSSLSFGHLGSTLKRYQYLTLPASTLEKFLSMWLLTSFGWIVVYTVFYTLYTMIANMIGGILLSYLTFTSFRPFEDFVITVVRYYFVTQGIFLVGATHFKGYVFPKTLFALILFAFAAGLIAYFLIGDIMNAETEECISDPEVLEGTLLQHLWSVVEWLFWWVLAPLCWVITYMGLKEKEA